MQQAQVLDNYTSISGNYDEQLKLFCYFWKILGFRYEHWRKHAIDYLELNEGNVVIDIGCGTGLNFAKIQKRIGKTGHIIGVDINPNMLEIAKHKITKNRWNNVSLVLDDAANYKIPSNVDAIISSYSLSLISSFDKIIENSFISLKPSGKICVLDFKYEKLSSFAKIMLPLWLDCVKDYPKGSYFFEKTGPWNSIKKYFSKNSMKEWYGGLAYLSVGTKT